MSEQFLLHSTYARSTPEVIGEHHGQQIVSSLRKRPVPVHTAILSPSGLEGLDSQADLNVHGGPDKAVYVWPLQGYIAWTEHSGNDLLANATEHDPYHGGHFGENLLVVGEMIHERNVRVGDKWAWGGRLVEVTMPREPCVKLATALPGAAAWMIRTGHCGWYLKLASEPGPVPTYGTPIQVLQQGNGPTIAEAFNARMLRNGSRIHGID